MTTTEHTTPATPGVPLEQVARAHLKPSRLVKGLRLLLRDEAIQHDGTQYLVPSESQEVHEFHTVQIKPRLNCDCRDATYRGVVCGHLSAVLLATGHDITRQAMIEALEELGEQL